MVSKFEKARSLLIVTKRTCDNVSLSSFSKRGQEEERA